MSARSGRAGFALIADVVESSSRKSFKSVRDRHLRRLTSRHREPKWIHARYTVTAWDEFQTFLWDPKYIPAVLLHLRQEFAPWQLTIGIGGGIIEGWRSTRPINLAVGGEAFENARAALDELKSKRDKYPRLTRFKTRNVERDRVLNLVYGLHDTLARAVTERQWEMIGAAITGVSQDKIAHDHQVNASTVSRNLQRGHYWQMVETLDVATKILAK